MDDIMETVGLQKSYRGKLVVDDVSIHIPKGSIYKRQGEIVEKSIN